MTATSVDAVQAASASERRSLREAAAYPVLIVGLVAVGLGYLSLGWLVISWLVGVVA